MASESRQRLSLATLFGKKLTRSPSLDDLAAETMAIHDMDEGEEEGCGGDEEDERQRLRRARTRASMRVDGHGHKEGENRRPSDVSDGTEGRSMNSDEEEGAGNHGEDETACGDGGVSADVKQLQQQVETLLQVRVEVEDAWRYENQRLRERLTEAERQVDKLKGQLDAVQQSPRMSRREAVEGPSQRERELLRLLIRVVGRDQIRALVAQQQSPSSGGRSPAELRRQLVTRATSTAMKTRPGAGSPPQGRNKPTVKPLATRKHEMSDAM